MRAFAIVGLAAVLPLVVLSSGGCRRDSADEKHEKGDKSEKGEAGEKKPFHVEPSKSGGEPTLVLSDEAFGAAAIATTAASEREVADEVETFGVLVADPSQVGVLRAPYAGTIASEKAPSRWPQVGAPLEPGAAIGTLEPRTAPLTTAELADAQSRLAAARAEQSGTQAELDAARLALERARKLNALDKGVSDQAVEAAVATVKAGEAKLDAAKATVAVFEKVVSAQGAVVLPPIALAAPRGGEVVAVLAQPGENVEAGAELLRVADFSQLFADVRAPRSAEPASDAKPPTKARVVASSGAASLAATVVGPAPDSDELAPRLRLRVHDPAHSLRPGLAVSAWLETGAAPHRVVAVPSSAALRYASRTWVYVETPGEEHEHSFTRHAIDVLRADGETLLVKSGLEANAKVVTAGATTLLSQEQLAAGGGEGD